MTEQKNNYEKHGLTNTRLYNVWQNIKRRCYTKTNPSYKYYGGCGIKMCKEWHKSFCAFYEWAMENGYNEHASKGTCTIDRINFNGDYEPSNCRWISMKEQTINRRANRFIEYNGEIHCLVEWVRILGFNYSTLLYRLRRGWSVEKAFNKEV